MTCNHLLVIGEPLSGKTRYVEGLLEAEDNNYKGHELIWVFRDTMSRERREDYSDRFHFVEYSFYPLARSQDLRSLMSALMDRCTNFTDFNGAEINDLIQCTAPRSIAKSWVTGGITKDHIDNTILFMINESYDPDHEANKFMQNVHFNYQYYFGADLTAEVIEALKEGTVEASEAFKVFFVSCLEKSAEFKKRNEKYCKATERYAADKPQRANVKRAVSCAFK